MKLTFSGCPQKFYHRVMYLAPSSGHILLNLILPFKLFLKALSHLNDLARWSNTGADFRGSVLVRPRNGITSVRTVAHRQDIGRTSTTKLAMAGDGRNFWTCFKISADALPERATELQRQYYGIMASLMSVEYR